MANDHSVSRLHQLRLARHSAFPVAICAVALGAIVPVRGQYRADKTFDCGPRSGGQAAPYVTSTAVAKDGHQYQTLTIHEGDKTYKVPDERYSAYDDDKKLFYYNDDPDLMIPREYDFSPNGDWLLVHRKCMHRISVAYLYHKTSPTTFEPVHFGALRFDEAAWAYVKKTTGIDSGPLDASNDRSHDAGFERWIGNRAVCFGLVTDLSKSHADQRTVVIHCQYDLKSKAFKVVKIVKS